MQNGTLYNIIQEILLYGGIAFVSVISLILIAPHFSPRKESHRGLFFFSHRFREEQQVLEKLQSDLQDDKEQLNEVRIMFEERAGNEWIEKEMKVIEQLKREGVVNEQCPNKEINEHS